jgi:hypothetical protein
MHSFASGTLFMREQYNYNTEEAKMPRESLAHMTSLRIGDGDRRMLNFLAERWRVSMGAAVRRAVHFVGRSLMADSVQENLEAGATPSSQARGSEAEQPAGRRVRANAEH